MSDSGVKGSDEEEKKRRDSEWLAELEEEIFSGIPDEVDEEELKSDYDVFHDYILDKTGKAITSLEERKLEEEEEEEEGDSLGKYEEELDIEEAETVVGTEDFTREEIEEKEEEEEPDWLEEWEQEVAEGKWPDIIIPTPPKLPNCTVPEMFKFHHAYGYDCQKYFNLFLLSENEIIYTSGIVAAICNVLTGKTVFLRSTGDGSVAHVAVNPRAKHIAVAEKGTDPNIVIYDWPSLKILQVLHGGTKRAYAVIGYNPSGSVLVSHGKMPDNTVTVWDWRKGVGYCTNYSNNEKLMNLAFRPDNDRLYMVCGKGAVSGWSLPRKGGSCLREIAYPDYADVCDHLCFDFITEQFFVTGNSLGCIAVWIDWKLYIQASVAPSIPCHSEAIIYIRYCHEDGTIYTVGEDGFVRVWDLFKIMDERMENTGSRGVDTLKQQKYGEEETQRRRNAFRHVDMKEKVKELENKAASETGARKEEEKAEEEKEEEEEETAEVGEVEDNDDDDNPEDDEIEEQPLWIKERKKTILDTENLKVFPSAYDVISSVHVNYLRQKDLGQGVAKIQPRCLVKRFPSDDKNFDFFVQDAVGYIWEVNTFNYRQRSRRFFCFQKGPVADIATSPCSTHLVTLGRNGRMLFYNYDKRKLILVKLSRVGARCLLWLPLFVDRSGKVIIVGCSDGVMRVYVAALRELEEAPQDIDPLFFLSLIQATKVHCKRFTAMSINQMGTLLVTASKDQTVWMHRFDHRSEYVKVMPIGFINVSWATYSFTWKPFAVHTVLCCFYSGQAVELNLTEAAPSDPDNSYELGKVYIRTIVAKSVKSQFLRDLQIAEYERMKNEEFERKSKEWEEKMIADPEFRIPKKRYTKSTLPPLKLDPLYIPKKPSRIYFARYTSPNDVWLSFGDYDAGYLYEYTFDEADPVCITPLVDAAELGVRCCIEDPTGKFLLLGMEDGRVRVCRRNRVNHRDLSDYWSFAAHDTEYGTVTHIVYSYDNKFLFTCGLDGGVFSFYADPPPPPVPPPRTRVRLGKPRHTIKDIDGHSVLSLEEYLRVTLEKEKRLRASLRSQKIRNMLLLYKEKMTQLMEEETKFGHLGKGVRRQMDVPKGVRDASLHRLKSIEKCLWRAYLKSSRYYKPFSKVIQDVWGDVELQIVVSALGNPGIKAVTFYQNKLGEEFDEAMKKARRRLEREREKGRKPPPPSPPPPEEMEHGVKDELMDMRHNISEQPPQWLIQEIEPCRSHPKIKQALRRFIQYKRSKRFYELKIEEIKSSIVAFVEREEECTSDDESHETEDSSPFPREHPTVAKKLVEYLEIRKEMFELKNKFNEQVYALRDKKLEVLEKVVPLYENLFTIQKELNNECLESYPKFPMIDWRKEYPELCTEFSDEELREIFFPNLVEWKEELQRDEWMKMMDEEDRANRERKQEKGKAEEKNMEGAVVEEDKKEEKEETEQKVVEEVDKENEDEQTEIIDSKKLKREESEEDKDEQRDYEKGKEEFRKRRIEIRKRLRRIRREEVSEEKEEMHPQENLYETVLAQPLKKSHPYLKMFGFEAEEQSQKPKVDEWIDAFRKCYEERAFDLKTLQRMVTRGACQVDRFVPNVKGEDFWNQLFPPPNSSFAVVCDKLKECIAVSERGLRLWRSISSEEIDAEEDKKTCAFMLPSQLLQAMHEGGLPVHDILSAMKQGTFQLEDHLTLVEEEKRRLRELKEKKRREERKKAGEEKTVHFQDDLEELATEGPYAVREAVSEELNLDGDDFMKLTLKELLAMNNANNHNLPKDRVKSVRVYGFRGYRKEIVMDSKRRRTEKTYLYSYFDNCENYRNVLVHAIYINGELRKLNMLRFPKKIDTRVPAEILFRVPRYVDVLQEPGRIMFLSSSSQDNNKNLDERKDDKSPGQAGHRKRKSYKSLARDTHGKQRKEKFRVYLNEDLEETNEKLKTGRKLIFSKENLKIGIETGNLKLNEVLSGAKQGSFDIPEAIKALISFVDRNYPAYMKLHEGKYDDEEEEGEEGQKGGVEGGGGAVDDDKKEETVKKKTKMKKVKEEGEEDSEDMLEAGVERRPYVHPHPRLLRFLKKFTPENAGKNFWSRVPLPPFIPGPYKKNFGKYSPLKLPEMTIMEKEWVWERYHRRRVEQSSCIKEINLQFKIFDDEMETFIWNSHDVSVKLLLLELRRTQIIKQISILKTFEKGEIGLNASLKQTLEEWQEVMKKVNRAQSVIDKHQKIVDKLLEEDKAIVDLFTATISNNKFADYLMKIFRRIEEVAEVKKKESDEGDSTSTGSSTEGEDEETLRQRRMKLDPKVCPEGLSKEIYQLAFTLRDKRAEIEEKVAIQKGEIGALMLAFEEVDKEKRKTDENLKEAQENIAKAERSKRSSLDNVESVVPLTLEQFDARVYNDNFQWAECGPFLDVDLLQVEEEEQDEIVEEEEKVEDEEEQLIIKEKKVEEKIEEWADEQAEEEGEEKKSKDSKTEVIPRPDETLDIDEGVLVSSKQLWELRQREDVIRKHIEEEEEKYREDKEDLEEMRRENRKLERELLKRKQQLQEKMIATVGAVFPVELGHTALLVSALEKVRTKAHVEGHNYEQELKKLEIEKRIHRDNLSRLLQENTDKLYCLSVLEEMNLRAECAENVLARTQPKPTVDTDSKYEKEVHKLQRRIKRQHQEMLLLRQEIKTLSLKTKGPPPLVRKTPQPPPKLLKESSSVSSTLEPLGPDQENVSVTMVLGEEFVVEEILTEELGEGEKEEEEADKGEQYLPEPGVTEERQEDTEEESDIIPVDDIIMQIIQSIPFIESDVPEFLDRVVDELETTEAETHVKSILDDVIHELNVPLEENEGLEEKFSVVLDQIDRSSKSKEHIEEVRSILQDVILKSTQVADTSDEGQSDLEDEVKPQTEEPSDELE